MKKSIALILVLFIVAMIGAISHNFIIWTASASTNPCPPGEFPETDGNGEKVVDSITGKIVCSPGP